MGLEYALEILQEEIERFLCSKTFLFNLRSDAISFNKAT